MRRDFQLFYILPLCLGLLTSCSYNPFISNNHTTGSATAAVVGAGVGAGGLAILGGSKPLIALAGIGGGAVGYYASTLRYDSGGVIRGGGKVYKVGDFVGLYIPSDKLFEPNTADFLPQATPILDSAATVLKRYPNNNIVISGNTSGFSKARWEQKLSEKRAKKIAAYLWDAGVNDLKESTVDSRKLRYVGYGDYFPISQTYTNKGIRENSRIQITSYPTDCDLRIGAESKAFTNVGAWKDSATDEATVSRCFTADDGRKECFDND
jgi:outer membrane protein OmpA-like peptidoglycan-associated protein